MKVVQVKKRKLGDVWRIEAHFEGNNKDFSENLYLESNLPLVSATDANGFLLASYLPAMDSGEQELVLEGEVCPRLSANLWLVSSVMRSWFKDSSKNRNVDILAPTAKKSPSAGVGVFLSGGVDSMYTLLELTQRLPIGHPKRPTTAVLIDFRGASLSEEGAKARFERSYACCKKLVAQAGIELAWVRTDLRRLHPGGHYWTRKFHGAMLAAVAHFLSDSFGLFYIASSSSVGEDVPWGSHPMLDPLYSSYQTEISHHGAELSKFDKVGELALVEGMLENLHVCVFKSVTGENCGRCKKCLRTKLYLKVQGADSALSAFKYRDVTVEDVHSIPIKRDQMYGIYSYLLEQMRLRNACPDLADALEKRLKKYRQWRFFRRLRR